MTQLTAPLLPQKRSRASLSTSITLARWQFLQVWPILFLACIGLIAAVMVACIVPLTSQVAMNAGLRGLFQDPSGKGDPLPLNLRVANVSTNDPLADSQVLSGRMHALVQRDLQGYVSPNDEPALVLAGVPLSPLLPSSSTHPNAVNLFAYSMTKMASHVSLLTGRLPADQAPQTEVALTSDEALQLHAQVGSLLTILNPLIHDTHTANKLSLLVTGIIRVKDLNDPYWGGALENNDLQSIPSYYPKIFLSLPSLISSQFLQSARTLSPQLRSTVATDFFLTYHLDLSHLDTAHISDFSQAVNQFNAEVESVIGSLATGNFSVRSPADQLNQYQQGLSAAQLSNNVLTLLVIALLVFFACLMAQLLVERQSVAVAILRSRGASPGQIFGSLLLQYVCIAVVALVSGSLLSLVVLKPLCSALLGASFYPNDPAFLHPWQAVFSQSLFIGGTVLISVAAMLLSVYQATRLDVLALRRSASRSDRKPLWQRLYLDVVALVLAIASYVASLLAVTQGLVDPTSSVLLQGPLLLLVSVLLLLAGSLLFLRLFPLLLSGAVLLVTRSRGVVGVLSLETMARVSHHALRMILLLTFALAFLFFSGVFHSSQDQHMREVASYQAGADFSGSLFDPSYFSHLPLAKATSAYQQLPGVTAASLGAISSGSLSISGVTTSIKLLAVDPSTFISSTTWAQQSSSSSFTSALQLLVQKRADLLAAANKVSDSSDLPIPALLDARTWNALHLKSGDHLILSGNDGYFTFQVLAVVPSIPSVNDTPGLGSGEYGLVADYLSFAAAFAHHPHSSSATSTLAPNYVWLHSTDDSSGLNKIRAALNNGRLQVGPLFDRRAIYSSLQADPLSISQVEVLLLGSIAPILLALLGNWFASWLNIRGRITGFASLRALGILPSQILQILLCEQAIIYGVALVLGCLFGLLLASLTLPFLVFVDITLKSNGLSSSSADVFSSQNVPPVHMVVPFSLLSILLVLVVICLGALALMVTAVSRSSISQSLRLNED